MTRIYIAYAYQDRAIVERLSELLKEHGIEVWFDPKLLGNERFYEQRERMIRDSDRVLVLWSAASRESEYVRLEAKVANESGKLLPVSLSGVSPPGEFAYINTLELKAWAGQFDEPSIRALLDSLLSVRHQPQPSAARNEHDYDPFSAPHHETERQARSRPLPPSQPQPSLERRYGAAGMLGRVVDRFRDLWHFGSRKKGSKEALDTATTDTYRTDTPLDIETPEPVLLGASAPRQCTTGQRFTAVLVAYIDAARGSARKKLEALGEPDDRVVMDVLPQRDAGWQLGAPVAVRLTGEGVQVTPGEVRFQWSGRENLAAFAVRVHNDAPASVSICFEVFVADVPIAFIPMRLSVAVHAGALAVQQAQGSVPSSAFASYASKDAQPVTQRLSTLQRWSPGLDIFQDCLDLKANTSFQPQLKLQIERRDVFLLFWSRNAAASPWVQWEYQTARDTRGLDAILPMPLEDPAIAPPPPELADRHLRDRFMLAGYGLAKVRDEATRPPLT
jgi:hypothetical protein